MDQNFTIIQMLLNLYIILRQGLVISLNYILRKGCDLILIDLENKIITNCLP